MYETFSYCKEFFEKIFENFKAITVAILRAKPISSKGTYLKSLSISTTMGLPVNVDTLDAIALG